MVQVVDYRNSAPTVGMGDQVDRLYEPLVTVAIPTFRRLPLLRQAVESVLAQSYQNWELVVSDDEEPPSPTWEYLTALSKTDPRIRPLANEGEHGQVPNTNKALRHARGEWIKLLHDDDVLKPNCLSELVQIAGLYRERQIACITCGAERYENGHLRAAGRRAGWPELELIPREEIPVIMYMAEDAGGAAPSQKMIHRRVLDRGVLMERRNGLRFSVDSWFNVRIGECGDLLLYRKPLVEWHQGEHETETDRLEDGVEEEFFKLRDAIWELIPDRTSLPSPRIMKQMVAVQRALWRFRRGQMRAGFELLAHVRSPAALVEYFRWIAHNYTKGRIGRGRRVQLRP